MGADKQDILVSKATRKMSFKRTARLLHRTIHRNVDATLHNMDTWWGGEKKAEMKERQRRNLVFYSGKKLPEQSSDPDTPRVHDLTKWTPKQITCLLLITNLNCRNCISLTI